MKRFPDIKTVIRSAGKSIVNSGQKVNPGPWQAIEVETHMIELFGYSFRVPINETKEELQQETGCDLPWAEVHFMERVSGIPMNPGESYKIWPHYKMTDREDKRFRTHGLKFSHTYMERFWPQNFRKGIRFNYGNLDSVVNKLIENRNTRQAFLPVWFPEDTGLTKDRVPCTIGYLFNVRSNHIHVTYYIRSCDYSRHFHNDIYLAGRLAQWVRNKIDPKIKMGFLDMHIASFHIFETDLYFVNKKIKNHVRNSDSKNQ